MWRWKIGTRRSVDRVNVKLLRSYTVRAVKKKSRGREREREFYVDHFSLLTFTQHHTQAAPRAVCEIKIFREKKENSLNPSPFCDVVTVAALVDRRGDDDLVL